MNAASGMSGASPADTTPTNTNNPSRPDYECESYRIQATRWQLVRDIKQGIEAIRANKERYLPRFESESVKDWVARVSMTFFNNYYSQTLVDHVGLVFAEDPVLGDDVPQPLADLLENCDGEGAHYTVFLQNALEVGLDLGHGALWTDFPGMLLDAENKPVTANGERLRLDQFEQRGARPYMTLLGADEIISWRTTKIGGVESITQFVRREETTLAEGSYGTRCVCQYRVVTQAVIEDQDGTPIDLGEITWALWREEKGATGEMTFASAGNGKILNGPKTIPLRPFYGQKMGTLTSKPFFYDLAWTSVEETQLSSDDASVRHRCNVPTPWFSGLAEGESVNMSQGINLPVGGQAGYLEPTGSSLGHNRQKLEDVRTQMRRQGASMPSANDARHALTATESAQVAKQRNARLAKAARSLQDAFEAAMGDMAAFLKLPAGGSLELNKDFAGAPIDPQFVAVCLESFKEGAITRDELRHVLRTGGLPEDTDETVVAAILDKVAEAKAVADATATANATAALNTNQNANQNADMNGTAGGGTAAA